MRRADPSSAAAGCRYPFAQHERAVETDSHASPEERPPAVREPLCSPAGTIASIVALVNDDELLACQAALQGEAATFVRELGLIEILGGVGRVTQLGSAVTGLMVWRDLDFGVDAPGLTADAAWETMRPVLGRCSSLHYANDRDERRHYFVMWIDDWKVDVSLWFAGVPPAVEAFQAELPARLTHELRLTILRLKDFWYRLPHYPDIVSGWEIYDAVLNHQVRTLDELDVFLAARGLPTRRFSSCASGTWGIRRGSVH